MTRTKTIKVFPNQKSWLNSGMNAQFRAWNGAYRAGDLQAYKEAFQSLQKAINKAKCKHKQGIEEHFDNNTRNMLQGSRN